MLLRRSATAALALLAVGAPAAAAHGPCGCLDPVVVEAGQRVRIADPARAGYPAYRAVLNPRPADFGIAPAYLGSAYRAGAPTTTVLSRPRRDPTRKGRFRVPAETPPGLYMVLIWDGDEGGAHNTWAYLHVTDREKARPAVERPERADGAGTPAPWRLLGGVALGSLLLGAIGGRALRTRAGSGTTRRRRRWRRAAAPGRRATGPTSRR